MLRRSWNEPSGIAASPRSNSDEQPRGAAHAWAARGHILNAEMHLDELARTQASRSTLPDD